MKSDQANSSVLHTSAKDLENPGAPFLSEGAGNMDEGIYRSIFDHGLDGVFQSTPDGRYIAANNSLARMYGYETVDEMIAAFYDIGHQLYLKSERRGEFTRLMKEQGKISGFESEVYRRDASTMWISETARAIIDGAGNPLYYEGTVQDISRRKRAEDALRESERFIQRVADTSPAILYVYDLLEGRYLYVNHQVQKVLGYSVEDFLSKDAGLLTDLIHPEDSSISDERAQKLALAEDGQIFECCFRLRDQDGKWLWIQSRDTIFTRTEDGRPSQIIGMAKDVTTERQSRDDLEISREQLRALSARLLQVREEERLNIAREIHDDLGQTLTALNMDLSIISSRLARSGLQQEQDARERIGLISIHVDSMLDTIRRISAELRPPLLDELGLTAAVEWQAAEFQKRYGIRCDLSMGWKVGIIDQKLCTAVFRIFQEILTNVARHAKASKVLVDMRQDSSSLLLRVKDNGRGISQEEQSTSLGILGMRERALVFEGEIQIEGVPGRGTTVTVKIPLAMVTLRGNQVYMGLPKKETLGEMRRRARDQAEEANIAG